MMHKATIGIALFASLGLAGCTASPAHGLSKGDSVQFRGTGNGTYQIIVTEVGSCCGGDYYERMCCDTSPTSTMPCYESSSGCAAGETVEDVCIIPEDGTCAIITCIGDERSCSEEEDCFWTDILSDSGVWTKGVYVCLDLAPPMGCGGGGDPYPGPCESGN